MLTTILGILGSAGFGSVLGIFGSWITRAEERKDRKLQFEHELKITELDLRSQELEQKHQLAIADKQIDLAEAESKIETARGELSAFADSLKIGSAKSGVKWVDAFNGLMRPFITIFLLGVSIWITYNVFSMVEGFESLGQQEAVEMFKYIIYSLISMTSTAVFWWYGKRPGSNDHLKKAK